MNIKLIAIAVLALTTLTGCGAEEKDVARVVASTPSESPAVPTFEEQPIIDVPVDGVITGGRGVADITKLPSEEIVEKNPEKVKPVDPNAPLPDNFVIPGGVEYIEGASKLDGNQSHVVLGFDKDWKSASTALRNELESKGWECFECVPFVAVGENAGDFKASKYLLNMYNGETKVIIIISETSKGLAIASMNFSAK
jgi:hypothetical protein